MRYFINSAAWCLILAITIMTYASPVLLAITWYRRLTQRSYAGLRERIGWLSLVLSSLGIALLYVALKVSPDPGSAAFDVWSANWLKICALVSSVALLASIVGTGKMQWAIRLVSVIPPLSMIVARVFE